MTCDLFHFFFFGPVKNLVEEHSVIISYSEFENDIGLLAKSAVTGFSESVFMSLHFLIHVFLHKNIYFT